MKSGDSPCGEFADLSLQQVADRLAIREPVDAYAYCADRRDAAGQMALFTEETDFLVFMRATRFLAITGAPDSLG